MLVIASRFLNAPVPIFVTVPGMLISLSLAHDSNALFPISVVPVGMVMLLTGQFVMKYDGTFSNLLLKLTVRFPVPFPLII